MIKNLVLAFLILIGGLGGDVNAVVHESFHFSEVRHVINRYGWLKYDLTGGAERFITKAGLINRCINNPDKTSFFTTGYQYRLILVHFPRAIGENGSLIASSSIGFCGGFGKSNNAVSVTPTKLIPISNYVYPDINGRGASYVFRAEAKLNQAIFHVDLDDWSSGSQPRPMLGSKLPIGNFSSGIGGQSGFSSEFQRISNQGNGPYASAGCYDSKKRDDPLCIRIARREFGPSITGVAPLVILFVLGICVVFFGAAGGIIQGWRIVSVRRLAPGAGC